MDKLHKYKCRISIYAVTIVAAKDEEEAMLLAEQDIDYNNYTIKEYDIDVEVVGLA